MNICMYMFTAYTFMYVCMCHCLRFYSMCTCRRVLFFEGESDRNGKGDMSGTWLWEPALAFFCEQGSVVTCGAKSTHNQEMQQKISLQ